MNILDFFAVIAGIGALVLVLIISAIVLALYLLLRKIIAPQGHGWLLFGIIALVLIFIPDPADILTGGLPIIEVAAAALSAYKIKSKIR